MPTPPESSWFTRFLLENPWPLVLVLATAAIVAVVWAVRRDERRGIHTALALLILAVGAFLLERFVVTSGEHAADVTQELVDAAVAADTAAAKALFAPDASMAFGHPTEPGRPIGFIFDAIDQLGGRYRIDTNYVTRFDAYTRSGTRGEVWLTCITTLEGDWGGAVRTTWIVDVERQVDGSWQIAKLTFVDINDATPDPGLFR